MLGAGFCILDYEKETTLFYPLPPIHDPVPCHLEERSLRDIFRLMLDDHILGGQYLKGFTCRHGTGGSPDTVLYTS